MGKCLALLGGAALTTLSKLENRTGAVNPTTVPFYAGFSRLVIVSCNRLRVRMVGCSTRCMRALFRSDCATVSRQVSCPTGSSARSSPTRMTAGRPILLTHKTGEDSFIECHGLTKSYGFATRWPEGERCRAGPGRELDRVYTGSGPRFKSSQIGVQQQKNSSG